ncbi:MAG: hypothetical protein BWZ07_02794 [Alphaproteobacteria bacterium ADurb.BinA280]|nr:MAG: hypothetical protein BWZ07_02794 [Alphaproteobacteria bacterium ADurb.BinA280]
MVARQFAFGKRLRLGKDREIPLRWCGRQSQRLHEAAKRVQNMLAGLKRDTSIDHQAMQFLAAFGVKTNALIGLHPGGQQVGAQRQLHVQQGVEASTSQLFAELPYRIPALLFVEHDVLDVWDEVHQAMLEFADDPGDAGFRPLALQLAHHRQHMADIAQC